jgi:hypothetical protein
MNKPARLLLSGGALGAVVALFDVVTPAAVGPERWSYPHTATTFVLTEIPIVVAHVLTALGVAALSGLVATSRLGVLGIRIAAGALWLFAVCEVAAAAVAGELADSVPAQLVGAAFGVTSLVYASGAVAGGVAFVRLRVGPPWARWSLLVSGIFVVAVVDPATLGGNLAVRYLALASWSVMFCWMAPLTLTRDRAVVHATPMSSHDPGGVSS